MQWKMKFCGVAMVEEIMLHSFRNHKNAAWCSPYRPIVERIKLISLDAAKL